MDIEAAIRAHGSVAGACCWDLGAHFGIYTVGMALAVGPTGRVFAFEPDPVSFARCKRHIQMNGLSWVRAFNAAASDAEGTAQLIVSNGLGDSTSHLKYEEETLPIPGSTITIALVSLDTLVDRKEVDPPNFIKVDVEGHAAKALAGARRSIQRMRPTLVISFHSRSELDGSRLALEPLGYSAFESNGAELTWADCLYRTAILRCSS